MTPIFCDQNRRRYTFLYYRTMRHYTFFTATKMRRNTLFCPLQCIKRVLIICIYVMLHILKTDIFRHYTYSSVRYIQHYAVLDYAVSCGYGIRYHTSLYAILRFAVLCTYGIISFLLSDIIRIVRLRKSGIMQFSVLLKYVAK